MKKMLTLITGLLTFAILNAQSLDEIVKKYTEANKLDKLAQYSTIKLKAKMSIPAMGMDAPMEIWLKKPDKIRSVMKMMGMEIISAFDGTSGWVTDPMSGGVIEMNQDQIRDAKKSNIFNNSLAEYLKEGKLSLSGEESVKGSPAYKIIANTGSSTAIMFIDKSSYLLVKTTATVNQGGQSITAESYPSDYKEFNGILLPAKTTTSAQGMEMVMTFESVELNTPMEDSVFKLK